MEEHKDLLKNDNYEILQLQTTSNIYEKNENKMVPIMKYGSGTTIYKIKRNIVEDSAVTEPKIAANSVEAATLNVTSVTGHTEVTSVADND